MINSLPTIFEVVTGSKKQTKEKTSNTSSKSSKSNSKISRQSETKATKLPPPREMDESDGDDENGDDDEDEHGTTLCGACGDNYSDDEFWICCDICERWFHGKCVRITPARAEHIKQYKCPSCSGHKKPRP